MASFRKIAVVVFAMVFIVTASLLTAYVWLSRGCVTEIKSLSKNITLEIGNRSKWNNFINTVGNCKNGNFTVYITKGENTSSLVGRVKFVISDEIQSHKVTNSKKELLYTYNASLNGDGNVATITFNFPDNTKNDENIIHNAITITSYYVFRGTPYTTPDSNLTRFNSLSALGLIYENR
jgi:hypothetical protein